MVRCNGCNGRNVYLRFETAWCAIADLALPQPTRSLARVPTSNLRTGRTHAQPTYRTRLRTR